MKLYMVDIIVSCFHIKPIILPYNERNKKRYKSVIFGPTCDSIDKILDDVMLPNLSIDEILTCQNMRAYTIASQSIPDLYYYI